MDRAHGCHFGIFVLCNYAASSVALFYSGIVGTIGTSTVGPLGLQVCCLLGANRHIGIVLS
jgi:hypothetical protein